MREIKFRVWDRKCLSMHRVKELSMAVSSVLAYGLKIQDVDFILGFNEYDLMQCTGLKDKNGKEVYEGDVVEQEKWVSVGKYEKTIGIIKYRTVEFTCDCIGEWEGANAALNGNAIVIGNIYQNPELLNS